MLSTQLRDVKLNGSYDWDLSSGTFVFTSGIDGVAQAIGFIIRMHRGEWFMDLKKGFPYFERDGVSRTEAILGQRNVEALAIAEYTKLVLAVEGVDHIESMSALVVGRGLSISWTVIIVFDDIGSTTLSGTTLVPR